MAAAQVTGQGWAHGGKLASTDGSYSPFAPVERTQGILAEGRRPDSRFPEEHRPVFLNLGTVPSASGSAYLEYRDTKILCSVFGPRQNSRASTSTSEKGELRCDVKFTTFSSAGPRRKSTMQDQESKEFTACVHKALAAAVLVDAFPKATVDLNILVIEGQGGEQAAAITAASAALAHAGIPLRDLVLGATVAHVEGELLLDPSTVEEKSSDGMLMLALMPTANEVTQLTANGAWPNAKTAAAMELAVDGCAALDEVVREQLRFGAARRGRQRPPDAVPDPVRAGSALGQRWAFAEEANGVVVRCDLHTPWGNKLTHAWQERARAARPSVLDGGLLRVHPASNVVWASETVPACAAGGFQEGWWHEAYGGATLAANSCTTTLALAEVLCWARILRLAAAGPPTPSARVVPLADGRLHAADKESTEALMAAALLDLSATVQVCTPEFDLHQIPLIDTNKVVPAERSASRLDDAECASVDLTRDTCGLRTAAPGSTSPSRVDFLLSPRALASTRLQDAACWPKVWLFARKLLEHPEEVIGGPVPVRWNTDVARWTAGNRHRPVAHLLAGRPLLVTAKAKQVVSWAQQDGVKVPRKLAHLVADSDDDKML